MTDSDKVDVLIKYATQMQKGLQAYFKAVTETLVGRGLSESAVDNIILNTVAQYMAQMMTYVTVLIKASESGKDPTSEEMSETMEKISTDVFEAIQTILSKYSGKSILHVSKKAEGESP